MSDDKATTRANLSPDKIQRCILTMRGVQVILDRDLAELYGVPVKRLNEQVRRNMDRFPDGFMFQLSASEFADLKSQIATSSWGGVRKPPKVFTEQGVAMLSAVLNSQTAILVSIAIMDAFVKMRHFLVANAEVVCRMNILEKRQIATDAKVDEILQRLAVRYNETFHDRFLSIDDKELYLIGASLKDLGHKCFGFTKMDAGEIRRIKKSAFGVDAR